MRFATRQKIHGRLLECPRQILMQSVFYRYRYLLGGMLAATLLNCFLRFSDGGRLFFSALMLQLWFGQAVFAYFRRGWVSIGPGGLGKDAPAMARASL